MCGEGYLRASSPPTCDLIWALDRPLLNPLDDIPFLPRAQIRTDSRELDQSPRRPLIKRLVVQLVLVHQPAEGRIRLGLADQLGGGRSGQTEVGEPGDEGGGRRIFGIEFGRHADTTVCDTTV